jgi:uncharacterized delta-60 repeat protein
LPERGLVRVNPDGALDPGHVGPSQPNAAEFIQVFASLPDGKILVGQQIGVNSGRVLRLSPEGSIDSTFHPAVLPFGFVGAIAVGSDNKIVVGGDGNSIVRLNSDGSSDTGFRVILALAGSSVWTPVRVTGLAELQDGKTCVSGRFDTINGVKVAGFARLERNGVPDPGFIAPSGAFLGMRRLQTLLDDSVLVFGWDLPRILRRDGWLEPGPGLGLESVPTGAALALESNATAIVGGDHALARVWLNAPQHRSVAFTGGQFASEEDGHMVIPVVRFGDSRDTISVRYRTVDGTARAGNQFVATEGVLTFAPLQLTNSFTVALIDNGRPLGERTFCVELFEPSAGVDLGYVHRVSVSVADREEDSSIDYAFRAQIPADAGDPLLSPAASLPDGRILVSYGANPRRLVRINPDGTLDPSFSATFESDDGNELELHDILPQPDGRIIVAGTFDRVNRSPAHTVIRLGPDGTLDPALVCPFKGTTLASALQSNGKILVAIYLGDGTTNLVKRFNADGSVDPTFDVAVALPAAPAITPRALLPLPDGTILIGIDVGGAYSEVLRLTATGDLDLGFEPCRLESDMGGSMVDTIVPTREGRTLIGGLFTRVNGVPQSGLVQLLATGEIDPAFHAPIDAAPDLQLTGEISQVLVMGDARIVITGSFSSVDGLSRPGSAMLHENGSVDEAWTGSASGPSPVFPDGTGHLLTISFHRWLEYSGDYRLVRLNTDSVSPAFHFSAHRYGVSEASRSVQIEVARTGDVTGSANVSVATTDGSAIAGRDYLPVSLTLNFAPFERSKVFEIQVQDNADEEPDRELHVTLKTSDGKATFDRSTIQILDDDRSGSFALDFRTPFDPRGSLANFGAPLFAVLADDTIVVSALDPTNGDGVLALLEANGSFRRILERVSAGRFVSQVAAASLGGFVVVREDDEISRFNRDGSPDTNFVNVTANGGVRGLTEDPEGRFLLYGGFGAIGSTAVPGVARLLANGSLDRTFSPQVPPGSYFVSAAVLADGRIYLQGGGSKPLFLRLLPDGSIDHSFAPARYGVPIPSLSDGGVFLANPTLPNGERASQDRSLVKLGPDGAMDPGFTSRSFDQIDWVLSEPDGKLLISAPSRLPAGFRLGPPSSIYRLASNGSLDPSFTYSSGFPISAAQPSLRPDGRLLLVSSPGWERYQGILGSSQVEWSFPAIEGCPFLSINLAPPIQISDARPAAGGAFHFTVKTRAGQTLTLESSSDLVHWIHVRSFVVDRDMATVDTPARIESVTRQFFRISKL